MKKKITALTLALTLIFSLSLSALAATPRWDNTADCNLSLSFSGSTAYCDVTVTGNPGTSKITATVALKKSDGTAVRSWTETIYDEQFSVTKTAPNCAVGSYVLTVTATVYNKAGVGETVTGEVTGKR